MEEVFPRGKLFRFTFSKRTESFRVMCLNSQDIIWLQESLSAPNPSFFYMRQYGYSVPKTVSMINQFGYFPSGMLNTVFRMIRTRYGSLDVVAMDGECKDYAKDVMAPLKKYIGETFEISNVSEDSGRNEILRGEGRKPYEFRNYQEESVRRLIFCGWGKGMIQLPTASGKSFFIANYFYNLHKHVNSGFTILLLVPNKQLVFQMYQDFQDYGMDMSRVTMFTAGLKKGMEYDPNAKIILANRQFVFTNYEKLPKIDVVFCDEVHTMSAENTSKLIMKIGCQIKSGCSGSIPKDKLQRWKLVGMFGDVILQENITDLQKSGYISKLKITQFDVIDKSVERDRNILFNVHSRRRYRPDESGYSEITFNAAHDAEHEYYSEHYRELYSPVLEYMNGLEENILILFDRIEVGKRLREVAQKMCPNKVIHYIDGSVQVDERLKITDEVENSGNNIIFAENACFSTGINIKRLTHISFFCSTKSFSRILQSIGRTLRLHKTKTQAHVIDVNHNFKYSRRHLEERLKIYREEYGKTPDEIIRVEI